MAAIPDGTVLHAYNPGTSPVSDELYIMRNGRLNRLNTTRDLLFVDDVAQAFERLEAVGSVDR